MAAFQAEELSHSSCFKELYNTPIIKPGALYDLLKIYIGFFINTCCAEAGLITINQ